jgi:hypothetical protein
VLRFEPEFLGNSASIFELLGILAPFTMTIQRKRKKENLRMVGIQSFHVISKNMEYSEK